MWVNSGFLGDGSEMSRLCACNRANSNVASLKCLLRAILCDIFVMKVILPEGCTKSKGNICFVILTIVVYNYKLFTNGLTVGCLVTY